MLESPERQSHVNLHLLAELTGNVFAPKTGIVLYSILAPSGARVCILYTVQGHSNHGNNDDKDDKAGKEES
jgi:hypothetical protein